MLNILRFSINSIFDLYQEKSRSYYNFSLIFLVLSSIGSAIIAGIVILFADHLFGLSDISANATFSDRILDFFFLRHWEVLSKYIIILSFGLYAVYLRDKLLDNSIPPSLKDFRNVITTQNWQVFFGLTFVFSILFILSTKELFGFNNAENRGLFGMINTFTGEWRENRFYKWIFSISDLIIKYLPYAGALYLLLSEVCDKPGREIRKTFNTILLPVIILAFCLDAISGHLTFYIDHYVIKAFQIPFRDTIASGILALAVYFIIAAFFSLSIAGIFVFPVLKALPATEDEEDIPGTEDQATEKMDDLFD
jgi:hypothetical protein